MPFAPQYFTADMVRALPEDGQRYEVVHGELLVSPAPRGMHQRIVLRIARLLADYCDALGTLETMFSPADISWGSDILVQPDVFVVPKAEARTGDWSRIRTLTLVVEVLSPSTARFDRFQKRKLYLQNGVETLWLVDEERACVEVWHPDALFPAIESTELVWHPAGAADPLVIPLALLFNAR